MLVVTMPQGAANDGLRPNTANSTRCRYRYGRAGAGGTDPTGASPRQGVIRGGATASGSLLPAAKLTGCAGLEGRSRTLASCAFRYFRYTWVSSSPCVDPLAPVVENV